jgi:uncharacterized membrane protein YhaH (DUF805 family)
MPTSSPLIGLIAVLFVLIVLIAIIGKRWRDGEAA